ncbi:hypothetical protein ATY81_23485 [Rhizobium sp. R72]|uniref:helix-turn-helix transcriptional regulator n=1 Tax=unclassified Rhizobium TaxID=2613769 RepID=UPI000B532C20|nr:MULTISPECIES: helix-turn-helix transcriptional regulator [unclassified Rhizobium]OWW01911.1 hypothetical protein ATY81_23485 [Rhizobium sp. R72]OWW02014.1 hypothetical protein ATY80_23485 [Rhizobium sp. R711]
MPLRQEALETRLRQASSRHDFQEFFEVLLQSFKMSFGAIVPKTTGCFSPRATPIATAGSASGIDLLDKHRKELSEWISSSGTINEPAHWNFDEYDGSLSVSLEAIGICSGLTYADGGRRYVVLLGGQHSTLVRSDFNEICVILSRAMNCIDRLGLALPSGVALSPRETEVLGWISEGKSSAEAGMIVGLSGHTITAYLNNAMRKLDCVTRPQVVAKALRLKLIE